MGWSCPFDSIPVKEEEWDEEGERGVDTGSSFVMFKSVSTIIRNIDE